MRPQTPGELADLLKGRLEASELEHVIVLIAETEQRRYSGTFYDTALKQLGFQVSHEKSDIRIFPEGPVRALVYRRP